MAATFIKNEEVPHAAFTGKREKIKELVLLVFDSFMIVPSLSHSHQIHDGAVTAADTTYRGIP